jgi:hypothetical protein
MGFGKAAEAVMPGRSAAPATRPRRHATARSSGTWSPLAAGIAELAAPAGSRPAGRAIAWTVAPRGAFGGGGPGFVFAAPIPPLAACFSSVRGVLEVLRRFGRNGEGEGERGRTGRGDAEPPAMARKGARRMLELSSRAAILSRRG